ncbi:hypothetical protein MSAN_01103800 [Mycena sanguinolenta]|uniref:Uncharacterized protein n=1 Tax=Mycena sanguinolenta TaxID=230812 RepID=A0A8H6YNK9_9AGAR|nr:hypothetical protein MSAN_01103800 [Mycena sanguinolenta]
MVTWHLPVGNVLSSSILRSVMRLSGLPAPVLLCDSPHVSTLPGMDLPSVPLQLAFLTPLDPLPTSSRVIEHWPFMPTPRFFLGRYLTPMRAAFPTLLSRFSRSLLHSGSPPFPAILASLLPASLPLYVSTLAFPPIHTHLSRSFFHTRRLLEAATTEVLPRLTLTPSSRISELESFAGVAALGGLTVFVRHYCVKTRSQFSGPKALDPSPSYAVPYPPSHRRPRSQNFDADPSLSHPLSSTSHPFIGLPFPRSSSSSLTLLLTSVL